MTRRSKRGWRIIRRSECLPRNCWRSIHNEAAAKKEGLSKEEFKEQQMQQRLADTAAEKAAQTNADSAGDGESMKDIPSPMKQESGNAATPARAETD